MKIQCPSCGRKVSPTLSNHCGNCGCEVAVLGQIIHSARDSLLLSMLALREGRDRDAHEFARESWQLHHHRTSAAAGLIAATMLREPVEISRWIRRRRRLDRA